MTPAEQNELKGLKVHQAAWKVSIAAREAAPNPASARVLADEKRGLATIEARIAQLAPPASPETPPATAEPIPDPQ